MIGTRTISQPTHRYGLRKSIEYCAIAMTPIWEDGQSMAIGWSFPAMREGGMKALIIRPVAFNIGTPGYRLDLENGVISAPELEIAERKLASGHQVTLTAVMKSSLADRPAPDGTCTNLTENRAETPEPVKDWRREYYLLRTALRQATTRRPKYKFRDTAEIAEELLKGGSLENATRAFGEILDVVEKDTAEDLLRKHAEQRDKTIEENARKHAGRLLQLRDEITRHIEAGIAPRYRTPHRGGPVIVNPTPHPLEINRGETVIPYGREQLLRDQKMGRGPFRGRKGMVIMDELIPPASRG